MKMFTNRFKHGALKRHCTINSDNMRRRQADSPVDGMLDGTSAKRKNS